MTRLLDAYAYGPGPRAQCFWGEPETDPAQLPRASSDIHAKYVVIGAGFTGLNAALTLAEAGQEVVLIDAETPGWGASARNGGFCCLGGTALPFAAIRKTVGEKGLKDWCATEATAIDHVSALIQRLDLDVDQHSKGETVLAHSPRAMKAMRAEKEEQDAAYGFASHLSEAEELPALGMTGRFYGALTRPRGFGLNPRKLVDGLTQACLTAGVRIFAHSAVQSVQQDGRGFRLLAQGAKLRADKVIFATNGYASEDIPPWMRGRYLPLQSNVIVTRPLTADEIATGWSSDQMAYTHQLLLHYFRLMPDGRFLFGMRGGLWGHARADQRLRKQIRQQFEKAFPMWGNVETPYSWNGVLAFSAKLAPYVGPIPEMPGAFTGFGYHGNGIAMGSYAGALLADLAMDGTTDRRFPDLMRQVPKRFPLGSYRRLLMAPGYALAALAGQ